jgi:AraC-like DNA-binding protein
MSEVRMRYAFPDPKLFDLAAIYIETSVISANGVEDLIPPDMASIRLPLSGTWQDGPAEGKLEERGESAFIYGPMSKAHWLRGRQGCGFAIGLHPLAWPVLIGQKADRLVDCAQPLADYWQGNAAQLIVLLRNCSTFEERVEATNAFLLAQPRLSNDAEIARLIMVLRTALADPDCASAKELSDRTGLSPSRLARLTTATFGFTPKHLILRERFRRMLHRADLLSYSNWRDFIDSQYSDQSHLIRDFQRFLGMSPSQYLGLERPFVAAAFAEFRRLASTSAHNP